MNRNGWSIFQILSKKYMKTKVVAMCVLLLPILVCGILFLSSGYIEENTVSVGVYCEEDGTYESQLMAVLSEVSEYEFVEMDTEEDLRAGIVDGSILQGYVIEEGFSEAISDVSMKKTIRLIKLPDNMYYTQINETMNGAVFQLLTPIIAEGVVESREIEADAQEIRERIASHLIAEDAFVIDVEYGTSASGVTQANSQTMEIVRGVICVFLLVLVCTSTIFTMENRGAIKQLAPYLGRFKANVYFTLPIYVYGFLSAVFSLCLVAIFGDGDVALLMEIFQLLLFVVGLLLCFGAVAFWVPLDIFVALIPFLLVGVCITHPILFDFTLFFPKAKYVLQFLPTYQYLTFDMSQILAMLGSGIVYALLILLGSLRGEGVWKSRMMKKQGGTNMKFCDQCGTKLTEGNSVCPNCGADMGGDTKRKIANRTPVYIAVLLMIVAVGAYGVLHKNDVEEVEETIAVVEDMETAEVVLEEIIAEAEVVPEVAPEVIIEESVEEEISEETIEEATEEVADAEEELAEAEEATKEATEEAEATEEPVEVVAMAPTEVLDLVLGVWDPVSNQLQTGSVSMSAVYQSGGVYCYQAGVLGGETYSGTLDLDSVEMLSEGVYQVGVNDNAFLQVIYFNIADVEKGVLYVGMAPGSWIPCSFVSSDLDEGMAIMEGKYL